MSERNVWSQAECWEVRFQGWSSSRRRGPRLVMKGAWIGVGMREPRAGNLVRGESTAVRCPPRDAGCVGDGEERAGGSHDGGETAGWTRPCHPGRSRRLWEGDQLPGRPVGSSVLRGEALVEAGRWVFLRLLEFSPWEAEGCDFVYNSWE